MTEGDAVDEYRILFAGFLKDEVAKLGEQARSEGRLTQAKEAFRSMMRDLQADPKSIGELLYHTKLSGRPVFHVARSPWSIHFIVNDDQRVVLLSKIALMTKR